MTRFTFCSIVDIPLARAKNSRCSGVEAFCQMQHAQEISFRRLDSILLIINLLNNIVKLMFRLISSLLSTRFEERLTLLEPKNEPDKKANLDAEVEYWAAVGIDTAG